MTSKMLFKPINTALKKWARILLSDEINQIQDASEIKMKTVTWQETNKVSVIVDHMQQAFFSVGNGGIIVDPITKYTEKVFERSIIGENVMNTLYKQLENKKENYDAVRSALLTAIGEDELQWDLVEANFPRKIEYFPTGVAQSIENAKLFRINISPIWDVQGNLERLLFIVEDITDLEKLETQFKQEQEQTAMIECVLENSIEELTSSIKKFHVTLKESRSRAKNLDPVSFVDLLRILHTMKGHARQLKMRVLSDQVHQSEKIILDKMSEVIQTDNSKPVVDEIDKIENVLDAHSMLIQKFLRADVSSSEGLLPIQPVALIQSWEMVAQLKKQISVDIFNQLQLAWSRIEFKSMAHVSTEFTSMITDISQQLSKKIKFKIYNDALVSSAQAITLQECLLHLVRNSIDHGIETPDLRLQNGKTEEGEIRIEFTDHMDSFTIVYADDGQGVDHEKVVKKALKSRLITNEQADQLTVEQKVDLIFLPYFSTKEVSTDISGRGFGMDVVKESVMKLGGTIHLATEVGKGLQVTIKIDHQKTNKLYQVA